MVWKQKHLRAKQSAICLTVYKALFDGEKTSDGNSRLFLCEYNASFFLDFGLCDLMICRNLVTCQLFGEKFLNILLTSTIIAELIETEINNTW